MQEYWFDTTLLGFDGTVLEVFGGTDVHRSHIYHIHALALSTSRRGTKSLTVITPGRGTTMITLETAEHVAAAHALIAAVNRARAARGWPPVPTT